MIEYRGIEVTAENERYARKHIAEEVPFGADSDLYLQIEVAFGSGGYKRAAGYLLEAPAEHRASIVSEANIISNMVGMRYADAVWQVVQSVLRGDLRFPYIEKNRQMLAHEREVKADKLRLAAAQLANA